MAAAAAVTEGTINAAAVAGTVPVGRVTGEGFSAERGRDPGLALLERGCSGLILFPGGANITPGDSIMTHTI